MNYSKTLEYLFAQLPMFHRIGAAAYKADLDTTIALCTLLGNPQESFRSVHVAGTNGKGSVSHMLASIFQEHGMKTGLFTSPHLKDFRERIRINGRMIPKQEVTNFIARNKLSFESLHPSFFEMTAGLAFDHFAREKVDIAVIETGLGGRLDSTNIITPLLSVITNISRDHMQFLGDTLEKIAAEKAGIIKIGIPVVIGETQDEVMHVFQKRAAELHAPILFADQHVKAGEEILSASPLKGYYQRKNITTVLGAIRVLNNTGMNIPENIVQRGIRHVVRNTRLAGRWQILAHRPLTICDTGHNEAGIRFVLEQIRDTPHEVLHFVFGMVSDKEPGKILSLLPQDARYYFCKPDIPRGLDAGELAKMAAGAGLLGTVHGSVAEALAAARANANAHDMIFIGGSTFVVAEVV